MHQEALVFPSGFLMHSCFVYGSMFLSYSFRLVVLFPLIGDVAREKCDGVRLDVDNAGVADGSVSRQSFGGACCL